MRIENKHISSLINFLKLLLFLATFGFIFYKLFYAYHFNDLILIKPVSLLDSRNVFLISFTIILSWFNWMLEASKWRLLINKFEYLSYSNAVKAVLSGIALSIITPNQIGDFAGRIIHLKHFSKIKGSLVTVIGHTAQMIMTAAFGLYAFAWLACDANLLSVFWSDNIYIPVFLSIGAALFLFFNIRLLSRIKLASKIDDYLSVFARYSRSELLQVLILAFLRYCIFIIQYYLLLKLFEVSLKPEQAFVCIVATLCAQSFVPSFILIELGMRGASALLFFSMYTSDQAGVLLSAYTLWIINLMIPGLLGLGFIMRWRLYK